MSKFSHFFYSTPFLSFLQAAQPFAESHPITVLRKTKDKFATAIKSYPKSWSILLCLPMRVVVRYTDFLFWLVSQWCLSIAGVWPQLHQKAETTNTGAWHWPAHPHSGHNPELLACKQFWVILILSELRLRVWRWPQIRYSSWLIKRLVTIVTEVKHRNILTST